jgi:hypothetical protein
MTGYREGTCLEELVDASHGAVHPQPGGPRRVTLVSQGLSLHGLVVFTNNPWIEHAREALLHLC